MVRCARRLFTCTMATRAASYALFLKCITAARVASHALLNFPAAFLPVAFARQRLFYAQLFTRLQIEGMPFDLFDDVFLLHLAFEAPEGVFQGFTFLESYFSQNLLHLPTDHRLTLASRSHKSNRQTDHTSTLATHRRQYIVFIRVLISYGLD